MTLESVYILFQPTLSKEVKQLPEKLSLSLRCTLLIRDYRLSYRKKRSENQEVTRIKTLQII